MRLLRDTCFLITVLASTTMVAAERPVEFNDDIRPILSKHCIACHGPDEEDREAGLRLDTFEGATEDFGGYAAVSPGHPDESELLVRVASEDPDQRMPPADHSDPLSPAEIETLKNWIQQGADYQTHWSFAKLTKQTPPQIDDAENVTIQNPIDAFILRRVHEAGLKQNAPSDPRALVRRLSLDLTGLPPIVHDDATQQSIKNYLDSPSQETLSPLVDQLLHSPAYAEHWAAIWLDIARYADTVGYAGDEKRDIWPWRDWLIRALDSDKSYKDLAIEMLAGDMLENATEDQRLATAFHRNTLANNEGGTNDEEFRVIAVKDRLSTTLNAWMGLTVRCAECHSHKYDPISQVEYYQLLDFFNQTVDADNRDDRPKLATFPDLDPKITKGFNDKIAKLQTKLADAPDVWKEIQPTEMISRNGTQFELLDDDSILTSGPNPDIEEYSFTIELPAGSKLAAIRLEALTDLSYDGHTGRSPEGAFILSQIRLERHEGDERINLLFGDAENDFNQVNQHAKTAIKGKVESGGKQGWAVNHPVDGYKAHREAVFQLKEPVDLIDAKEPTTFTVHLLHDPPWPRLNMGRVRLSWCDVDSAAAKYRKKELEPIQREINSLIAKRDAPVRVPVIQQRSPEQQRETFVMIRGNFQSPDERVSAKFPDAFPPADPDTPLDRLGLSNWLFDDANPLTARVAVNRYWARLMGVGIVETEEDFGTQGSAPSHPELLDHLAVDFRQHNWDTRWLLREIVMSATYQQSPTVTSESVKTDPRNRLLSQGPRVRLTAEVVRDQALAVTGLLSKKRFGPPVYPPSPVKRVVNAFTGGMTWKESAGEDRYRRAIYTFLKRSAPHPLFQTFDMASRDVCSMRRLRTNTPLQSFMTLNDVTFIEAARQLADTMIDAGDRGIQVGYEAAIYQSPDDVEIETLNRLYQSTLKKYETDVMAAAELMGDKKSKEQVEALEESQRQKLASRAAMTVVANVILNLDGFLNN